MQLKLITHEIAINWFSQVCQVYFKVSRGKESLSTWINKNSRPSKEKQQQTEKVNGKEREGERCVREQAGKRKLQRPTASKQINATEILQKQKHQQQQEQQQGAGKGLTCARARERERQREQQPRGQNNGAGSGNKNGAQVQPRGTWHVSPKSLKCLFG